MCYCRLRILDPTIYQNLVKEKIILNVYFTNSWGGRPHWLLYYTKIDRMREPIQNYLEKYD